MFRRADQRTLIYASCLLFAFALLPPFAYYVFDERPTLGLQIFYGMPIFRPCEFVLGMITVPTVRLSAGEVGGLGYLSLALTCVCLAYLGLVGGKLPLYVGHNWIIIPAVAFLLIALSTGRGFVSRFLASKIMDWFGRISYCFYSFQFHVFLLVGYIGKKYELSPIERFALAFVLLTTVSALGYHLIEEPMQRYLRKRSWQSDMFSINRKQNA